MYWISYIGQVWSVCLPKFSVIIVNFNGGEYVQNALNSLSRQSERDFEVILVDNASEDGSVDALNLDGLPAFRLEKQSENLGFAGGNNLGAHLAAGEWLALLNPDAFARDDWLAELRRATERHPDTKVFASAQVNLHDPTLLDGVGDAYLAYGFPWRGGFCRPVSELPGEGECFTPCGAAALFQRDVYLQHGGFDERFFCFCEDVDLGFRLQLSGERCIFIPTALVEHAGGALSGQTSDFTIYHGYRNRIWVYGKNMPLPLLIMTLPGNVAMHFYLLLRAAMTGRFAIAWRGVRDGVLRLREIRASAQWPAPKRRRSVISLARAMNWNPFTMSAHRPHVSVF